MGAIAASARPDKLQRYRDVILASASFPVMFPPVYIPVEISGERFWEAHVDGAARAAVFAQVFMLDLEDVIEQWGTKGEDIQAELYLIVNGSLPSAIYQEVSPKLLGVLEASINTMLEATTLYSVDVIFVMAMLAKFDLRVSWIPDDVELSDNPLVFDRTKMSELFQTGYEAGGSGNPWYFTALAPDDPGETLDLVHPDFGYHIDARDYPTW